MKIIQGNKKNIKEIITALKNGAVLVLPTDTVYGLVCDATNKKAVSKIYKIKKRDKAKPLGIFVKSIKYVKKFSFINKDQEKILEDNKITVILKSKGRVFSNLVYKNKTIGIRVPKYKLLNCILDKFKNPIAQTSANISGKSATIKIKDILKDFKNEDVLVVDTGNLPKAKPSTIIDLSNNNIKIIRN